MFMARQRGDPSGLKGFQSGILSALDVPKMVLAESFIYNYSLWVADLMGSARQPGSSCIG